MTNFVIKYHDLYFNKYPSTNYTPDVNYATKFIHPARAKQEIIDSKLGKDHKVYQINFVELEVK